MARPLLVLSREVREEVEVVEASLGLISGEAETGLETERNTICDPVLSVQKILLTFIIGNFDVLFVIKLGYLFNVFPHGMFWLVCCLLV